MTIIFILIALIYVLRFIIMVFAANKERQINRKLFKRLPDFSGFVSVIIPARNEENNIATAIKSVAACNFPKNQFEIIAVNDRSDDRTGQILDNLALEIPNLKIVHLTDETKDKNLRGKPGALQAAIDIAKGDIFMFTDADCTVHVNWIATVSRYFSDPQVGLVPAYTIIKPTKIFSRIQALEWLYLHTFASGAIALKKPMGCYGNNLSVRRFAFEQIGGYANIDFSVTEDLALLQAIHRKKYRIHYLTNHNASVTTLPVETFREYVSQHHRWAIGGLKLGWIALTFVFTTLSIWLGFFLAIFTGYYLIGFGYLLLRAVADFFTYFQAVITLKQKKNLYYSPIALPFFFFFELLVPFLLFDRTITWKGQKFKKNA
ncbi:MAG: hypothetical protein A2X64_06150 [Ignavibacteria bacterium GWF2_33_9]|nr:MAG: hypothetical protein A2X64_06150 [Ignavibacteria bacterium GWF2_33_9]